jgi:hypothetical protein
VKICHEQLTAGRLFNWAADENSATETSGELESAGDCDLFLLTMKLELFQFLGACSTALIAGTSVKKRAVPVAFFSTIFLGHSMESGSEIV